MITSVGVQDESVTVGLQTWEGEHIVVCLMKADCGDRTYIDNFGRLCDCIEAELHRKLDRHEVFYLAQHLREPVLSWSK